MWEYFWSKYKLQTGMALIANLFNETGANSFQGDTHMKPQFAFVGENNYDYL